MALKPVQAIMPLGQFDGYDVQYLNLKGGEVVTFASVEALSSVDKAASDSFDGYMNPSGTAKRTVVTNTLTSSSRPLMLADDGISGYGTSFGSVCGGVAGQLTTGSLLGPHTATGSGKVTVWAMPGLFGVTLDAVDTSADGLVPTNTSLNSGAALTYTATGLLTPVGSTLAVGGAPVVGRFVEFETNGALVNTPSKLVNPLAQRSFTHVVFWFAPPTS